MNSTLKKQNDSNSIEVHPWYFRTGDTFYIDSPCIFATGLTLNEVYEIHDFTEPDTKLVYIKLLWVYLIGFRFNIVGVDITNGDILKFNQRQNAPESPCSFLICDLFHFDEDINEKLLKYIVDDEISQFNKKP